MAEHNPDHLVQIAAVLLTGRHDAEPHHVKQAVSTARLILDEANGVEPEPEATETEAEVVAEAEPEADKAEKAKAA